MSGQLLIAGGGLGGLAAALGARRAGWDVRLFEQAREFSEVGAGIQLAPNALRVLSNWDLLQGKLAQRLVFQHSLQVRDAADGRRLAAMPLDDFAHRYGWPYASVHRADLHAALLEAAEAAGARLDTGTAVVDAFAQDDGVRIVTASGAEVEADGLIAADGVWSSLRDCVVDDGAARPTGHLAYRALVRPQAVPGVRVGEITAWLGPRMHLVTYAVRGGEWINLVCVVHGEPRDVAIGWDHAGTAAQLRAALGPVCAEVASVVEAVEAWGLWALHDRSPVRSAAEMARGRIALLGDAAHPMQPYLAQGAGMALEDARELQRVLTAAASEQVLDLPLALRRYALNRWQRCARVQARSRRNAHIFHATGALRWGRNLALRLLGERLLDLPWLYRH